MAEERRKSTRYPLVLAVTWPEPASGKDHTEDLSSTGLFIRTERIFTKGERIPVELSFPGLLERTAPAASITMTPAVRLSRMVCR